MRNVSTAQGLTHVLAPGRKFRWHTPQFNGNISWQPSLSCGPPPRHDTLPVSTARRGSGLQPSLPTFFPLTRTAGLPSPPETAALTGSAQDLFASAPQPVASARLASPSAPTPPPPPPPFSFSPIPLPALLPQGLALGPWAPTWVCEWTGLKRLKAGSETSVVNLEGGWWTPGPDKKSEGAASLISDNAAQPSPPPALR